MWCVILQPKGTSRNAMLPADQKELLSTAGVGTILRRATAPELIGTYKWNGMTLHLFGYKTGKAGTENKHELPPPHDKVLLFGDVVLIATKGSQMVSFATTDYQKFNNEGHGGFEDIGSHDSEDEDADEEDEEDLDEEEEIEDEDDAAEESEGDDKSVEIEEEEDDEAPRLVHKPVIVPKRTNKKLSAAWYSFNQLTPEDYTAPPISKFPDTRQKIINIIKTRCSFLSETDQADFERGIFNYTVEDSKRRCVHSVWENPEFTQLYLINARRTISNIDPSSYISNARLLERFHDSEFKPHDIAFMTYSDLFPEKWGAMIELAIKREAKMLEVDKSMATDMFKCSRCGKRQCTYYEMQTRSADEPMTQFIRCLNCGKQWRQ
jgi:DNA-directed RNA polymerase subunit M/transcription elongation factor TFIIS